MSAHAKPLSYTPTAKQVKKYPHRSKERRSSGFNTSEKQPLKKLYRNYSQYINNSSIKRRKNLLSEGKKTCIKYIKKGKKGHSSVRKGMRGSYHRKSNEYESTVALTSHGKKPRLAQSYIKSPNAMSTEYSQGLSHSLMKRSISDDEEIPNELDETASFDTKEEVKRESSRNKMRKPYSREEDYLVSGRKCTPQNEETKETQSRVKEEHHDQRYSSLMAALDQSNSAMASFQVKKSSVAKTRSSVFKKQLKSSDRSPSRVTSWLGMKDKARRNKASRSPSLLNSRAKMSPSRELEEDKYIDKADKILVQQKGHINNLKWAKEEIIDEITEIQQLNHEEKVRIRIILERQQKITKNIEKENRIKENYIKAVQSIAASVDEENSRKRTLEQKYFTPIIANLESNAQDLITRIAEEREEIETIRQKIQDVNRFVKNKGDELEDCIIEACEIQHNLSQDIKRLKQVEKRRKIDVRDMKFEMSKAFKNKHISNV
ncbi:unnamed protein product [Moneuplotes crassus]|uniref:Uncharacterized protein n=1 Tax=Euplotes crassus TaxID=5936 RepID=A0AAD1UFN3_EUPCR|nr:unnamed protein product [Moneuplotes crassus]